jgi:bacterioferritin
MMEIETIANYLACSIALDGIHAEPIKKALSADIAGELAHATQLGNRIKQLGGSPPGSLDLEFSQKALQVPRETTDILAVIRGVIAAEESAIAQYNRLIRLCDGADYVTQDLCITLLSDEEGHLIEFQGFLKDLGGLVRERVVPARARRGVRARPRRRSR